MTEPQPNDRLVHAYASTSARQKIERPVSVSLLAYLGIVVASASFFCNVLVMVGDAILLTHPERSSPMKGMTQQDPMVMKIGAANAIAGMILMAILLGGSIASLGLRSWARRLILLWSFAFILCGIARTIGEIKYVGPANIAWVERNQPENADLTSGKMQAILIPKAIGVFVLYYCALPLLYFAFWTRGDVIDAFNQRTPPN